MMARTRTIKPEFWDDQKLCSISRDARLTFIGLWTNSDDYGVVKGHPAWIKSQIFPYDDIKIQTFKVWLDELEKLGVIVPFSNNGENYYNIKNFNKHQKINRPSESKNPSPPLTLSEPSVSPHGALIDETETETETETHTGNEPSLNGIPYKKIQEAFQRIIPDLPEFTMTDKRKEAIRKRWNTDDKTAKLEWWTEQFFPLIADSEFLTGRSGKWTSCNIDWILKSANFQKIREGTYNR